jgi:integrase
LRRSRASNKAEHGSPQRAFSFAEEFPDYRLRKHIGSVSAARTCNDVFDEFLVHAESRVAKHVLAFATADGYRKILENVWRPKIGTRLFSEVRYSELMKIADAHARSKKTYNNVISALRCAFDYGKTSTDRLVELCPRALQVLKRHLALRARLQLAGKIQHDELFFKETGEPIRNLQYPWVRWRSTLPKMKARYCDAYNARHSSESWNLMVGKNPLWVAKQHGHSVQTMLETYAAWTEGAQESDVEAIRPAMAGASERVHQSMAIVNAGAPKTARISPPPEAPEVGSRMAADHPSMRVGSCSTMRNDGGEREGLLAAAPLVPR